MAKRSISLATSHNSFEILIFYAKCLHEFPIGSRGPNGAVSVGRYVKIGDFRQVTCNITHSHSSARVL